VKSVPGYEFSGNWTAAIGTPPGPQKIHLHLAHVAPAQIRILPGEQLVGVGISKGNSEFGVGIDGCYGSSTRSAHTETTASMAKNAISPKLHVICRCFVDTPLLFWL
jgi:hypothetical protein